MLRSKMTAEDAARRFTVAIGLGRVAYRAEDMRQFTVSAWDVHGYQFWVDKIWLPAGMDVGDAVRLYAETNLAAFLELRPVESGSTIIRMDITMSGHELVHSKRLAKAAAPA